MFPLRFSRGASTGYPSHLSPAITPRGPCWVLDAFKAAVITASTDPGSSFSLPDTTHGYHQEGRELSWGKILPYQDVTGEDKEACSGTVSDNKSGQPVPRTIHSSR